MALPAQPYPLPRASESRGNGGGDRGAGKEVSGGQLLLARGRPPVPLA